MPTNDRIELNRRRRAPAGAALIYALAAVLIISILILGVGRLVTAHYSLEESSRAYAQAYYNAEAALNWQISRMSRAARPGVTPPAGRIAYSQIFNYGNRGTVDNTFADFGMDGSAQLWLKDAFSNADWTPPGNFFIYAVGREPRLGIQRGLYASGQCVTLGERYALFGANAMTFNSDTTGVTTLKQGYIGSNGAVTFSGTPPVGGVTTSAFVFGGCRLGPQGSITSGNWISSWDIPRMPDPITWPVLDEVFEYVHDGRAPSAMASFNDNARIQYKDINGVYQNFASTVTQLTPAEFDESPSSTIRLQADINSATGNVFYFTKISMRPQDILILDLRPSPTANVGVTAIRILLDGAATEDSTVTNLAYYKPISTTAPTTNPAYLWFNNTTRALRFNPNMVPITGTPLEINTTEGYEYVLRPGIQGMAYGLNAQSAANNDAGSIVVNGSSLFEVVVNCIVANKITLNGRITVAQPQTIEEPNDPKRYPLYYRITGLKEGDVASMLASDLEPPERFPVIGYGAYTP